MDPERALMELTLLTAGFLEKTAELMRKLVEKKPQEERPRQKKHRSAEKKTHKKSGYMLYSQHAMPELKKLDEYKSNSSADQTLAVLSKAVAAQWKSMAEEEKDTWRNKAACAAEPKSLDPALLSLLEDSPPSKRPRSASLSATESESEET